jgi:hypothetical protein
MMTLQAPTLCTLSVEVGWKWHRALHYDVAQQVCLRVSFRPSVRLSGCPGVPIIAVPDGYGSTSARHNLPSSALFCNSPSLFTELLHVFDVAVVRSARSSRTCTMGLSTSQRITFHLTALAKLYRKYRGLIEALYQHWSGVTAKHDICNRPWRHTSMSSVRYERHLHIKE